MVISEIKMSHEMSHFDNHDKKNQELYSLKFWNGWGKLSSCKNDSLMSNVPCLDCFETLIFVMNFLN